MKKTFKPLGFVLCFTIGLSVGVRAQLPSEKAVPLVLNPELKARMAPQPPAASTGSLPSEGRNHPRVVLPTGVVLPVAVKPPALPVEEQRKRLPSSSKKPAVTLKKPVGG